MILLDDRVGSAELANRFKLPVQLSRLLVGDAQFIDKDGKIVIVERKHAYELVNDFDRFVEQTRKAELLGYGQRVLIVENKVRHSMFSGVSEKSGHRVTTHSMTYKQYIGRLYSVMEYWHVLQTNTPDETVQAIEELYIWCNKAAHKSFDKIAIGDLRNVPIVERMYRQLPGFDRVGTELYKRFNTIEALQAASDDEIMDVKLLGKKKLEVIRKFIGRK